MWLKQYCRYLMVKVQSISSVVNYAHEVQNVCVTAEVTLA